MWFLTNILDFFFLQSYYVGGSQGLAQCFWVIREALEANSLQ
jgi:hypothetical protein